MLGGGRFLSKTITALTVELQNGGDPGRVSVSTGADSRTLTMKPAEIARFTLTMPRGVPYHRDENPTSYLYVISFGPPRASFRSSMRRTPAIADSSAHTFGSSLSTRMRKRRSGDR